MLLIPPVRMNSTCPFKDDVFQVWDVDHPPIWILVFGPVFCTQRIPPHYLRPHAQVDLQSTKGTGREFLPVQSH